MGRMIYKVLTAEQWAAAEAGEPIQAPVDVADGYVHFSTDQQIQATLSKWFKGKTGCVLASFDSDDFGPSLKWETARGGDLFPHVYGDVRAWQVRSLWLLEMGEDGAPLAPDEVVHAAPVEAEAKPGVHS
jgi:uncharacterized protein (DUF952 family)